jgi:hypothetical protein
MSDAKEKLRLKYSAVGNNILIFKEEKIKAKGPQVGENGLVSITSEADVGIAEKEYEVIAIGGVNDEALKLGSTILLHPSAMGGIVVENLTDGDMKYTVINVTLNNILAIVK